MFFHTVGKNLGKGSAEISRKGIEYKPNVKVYLSFLNFKN